MNKAVLAFLWEEWYICQLAERGLILDDLFCGVTVVCVRYMSHCVGIRSFISNEVLKKEPFGLESFSAGFEAVKMLAYNMSTYWDGRLYVSQ